jgi:hypothetical protein
MKNVHVLPTEKPSRLGYIFELESYHIFTNGEDANDLGDNLATNRHIYITDDSEIKVGDWFLSKEGIVHNNWGWNFGDKKIILTTDTDLIADGVQAIDDAFLEWFVQNPTCEVVGVKLLQASRLTGELGDCSYHIILPQDEAKKAMSNETIGESIKREGCPELEARAETKILGRRTIKTKTVGGNYCKWSVTVCKNGVSVIEQIILTKEEHTDGFTLLTTRFGKNVIYRRMSMKFDTICTITNIIGVILNEHEIKFDDIAR